MVSPILGSGSDFCAMRENIEWRPMERARRFARRLALRKPPAAEGRSMASMTAPHVEAASTLAVVASSNEPLLFLASDLTVIAASASFCRVFQIDPASVPGRAGLPISAPANGPCRNSAPC